MGKQPSQQGSARQLCEDEILSHFVLVIISSAPPFGSQKPADTSLSVIHLGVDSERHALPYNVSRLHSPLKVCAGTILYSHMNSFPGAAKGDTLESEHSHQFQSLSEC